MKRCPRCKGLLKERIDDFAKMGLKSPGIFKRNKVMECLKCFELWYEGKPSLDNKEK
jgi:uncharacterized protein with PIN domain